MGMAEEEVNPEDLEIADELIAERRAEAPGETPEDMTSWQRPITAVIDVINYRVGQIIALLMVPLLVVVVLEVLSRNSFSILQNAGFEDLARTLGLGPTLWVYDTSRMIAGVLFMAAAGYGLMRGVHIRADFLYRNWSAKTQATVDATLYLLFFMPSMIFFTVSPQISGGSPFQEVKPCRSTVPGDHFYGPRAWRCQSVPSSCCCKASLRFSAHFTRWVKSESVGSYGPYLSI
jgi:TRAP-type mannitol/chloroaromatic compound transport system permease small subunit